MAGRLLLLLLCAALPDELRAEGGGKGQLWGASGPRRGYSPHSF